MPYTLTAMDLKALRAANDISVHLNARFPDGRVIACKDNPQYGKDPFAERDIEYVVPIPVTEDKKAQSNFASFGLYRHGGFGHAASVIDCLKVGDEVSFIFRADGGANQNNAPVGLHVDQLWLHAVRGGKKRLEFVVCTCICPENTARMCKGVPFTEDMFPRASA